MGSEASIHKATYEPKEHADDIRDPVVHISTAIKTRLDDFNETAKGTRPNKNRDQSKSTSSGEGEGERCKSNEMYDLIAAVGRWRWGL